jgi:hypothetical protein
MLFRLEYGFVENDPLILGALQFYTRMFNDEKIANPELKEKYIKRIQDLIRNEYILKYYENNGQLLEMLLNGILKYMSLEGFCHLSSSLMTKIISPACFGARGKSSDGSTLIKVTKLFFENNPTIFNEFMDNYNKIMNKAMTSYTSSHTDSYNVIYFLTLSVLSETRD